MYIGHKQEFVNFFGGAYYNIEFGWDVVVGLDGVVRKWLCSMVVRCTVVCRHIRCSTQCDISQHSTIITHPDAHHRTISIPLQRTQHNITMIFLYIYIYITFIIMECVTHLRLTHHR